jgi:hypothetical protein
LIEKKTILVIKIIKYLKLNFKNIFKAKIKINNLPSINIGKIFKEINLGGTIKDHPIGLSLKT